MKSGMLMEWIWLKWQLLYWEIISLSLMGRYIGKSRKQPLALSLLLLMQIYLCMYWKKDAGNM